MAGYQFEPDETVVLRAQDVGREGGAKALSMFKNAELLLTNKNIVYPRKNMFGKIKDYEVHPLSDIRIVDGVVQCRLDSSEFMTHKLEISFTNELVKYVFGGLEPKAEVRSWIDQINLLLVGHEANAEQLKATGIGALADGDNMGDMAGRILGSFNNALNRKRAQGAPVVAHRCPSCNASLEGKRGSTVVCPYCESNVTIP